MVSTYDSVFWAPRENPELEKSYISYYSRVFDGCAIKTIHDCSFGSGNNTYPLEKMGYTVSGSDISENMIGLAREYMQKTGMRLPVSVCDFRELGRIIPEPVDCLISTGNSLPHVTNGEIRAFISDSRRYVKPNGYLYFDMRNWDRILDNRQRFYTYNLGIRDDSMNHLIQVWDYDTDGSVRFNLVFTTFDKSGKLTGTEIQSVPPYYPIRLETLTEYLVDSGFKILRFFDFTRGERVDRVSSDMDWYAVLAVLK